MMQQERVCWHLEWCFCGQTRNFVVNVRKMCFLTEVLTEKGKKDKYMRCWLSSQYCDCCLFEYFLDAEQVHLIYFLFLKKNFTTLSLAKLQGTSAIKNSN